jgi:polar amino acid transport system substrate-binding protein
MNRRNFLQMIGLTVPTAAATAWMTRPKASIDPHNAQDAATRILDTRQMRCGYISQNAPMIIKDPNTGQLSGIFYDLTERLGELAHLEILWTTDTSFATFPQDLTLGKYDVCAGGLWPSVPKSEIVQYSLPAFYSGLGVYVRNDDNRFDANVDRLNDPHFRIATLDGDTSQIVQRRHYPQASVIELPDSLEVSMLAETVITGKADATLIEKAVADLYKQKNPGSLRNLTEDKPLQVFKNTWAFAYGSPRLQTIIDTAVEAMIADGYVDQVLSTHGQDKSFYRVRADIQ